MKKLNRQGGFTLIELLVVVSIIALLAVGAVPLYGKIMVDMKAKAAMKAGYGIYQSLAAYASTHDQSFPSQTSDGADYTDSNSAYRQLFISGLCDDERQFWITKSEWHGKMKAPDGDKGTAEDGYQQALGPGECGWAYISQLSTDRDESNLPLLMDAGMAGTPGKWSRDPHEKGGVFNGRLCVVARVGGSVKVEELDPAELVVKDRKNGSNVDIFSDTFGTNVANILSPVSN